jgi:hypothetical protein
VVCDAYRDSFAQGGDLVGEKICGATNPGHENKMCRMCGHDVAAPFGKRLITLRYGLGPRGGLHLETRLPCCRLTRQKRQINQDLIWDAVAFRMGVSFL